MHTKNVTTTCDLAKPITTIAGATEKVPRGFWSLRNFLANLLDSHHTGIIQILTYFLNKYIFIFDFFSILNIYCHSSYSTNLNIAI